LRAKHARVNPKVGNFKFSFLAFTVVLVWIAITGVLGPLFGQLSNVQDNDNANFLPNSAESTLAGERAEKFRVGDGLPTVVVISGDLTPENIAKAEDFARDIQKIEIEGSDGRVVGDYLASKDPIFPLVSEDKKAILLSVDLSSEAIAKPLAGGEPALPAVVNAIRDAASEVDGLQINVAGAGGILADFFESFGEIDSTLLFTALTVVAVILLFVYRSPVLWILPLTSALLALATAGGIVYLLADNDLVVLNGQSQGILFVLVIGAATDYALLLVARYREELHHYASRFTAMKVAWRNVLEPTAASAATAIAALAVLLLSELNSNRSTGPIAALGIASAFVVTLTLLPAMLLIFGRWIFWPRIPKFDDEDQKLSGLWSKVASGVGRRPRFTWIVTALLLGGFAAYGTQFKAEGLSQTDSFVGKPDSVIGQEVLAEHFPAGEGNPSIIILPQEFTQDVTEALSEISGVDSVLPLTNSPIIPGQPPTDFTPRVVEGEILLYVTLNEAADSNKAREVIVEMREAFDEISDEILVGGFTAVNYDIKVSSQRDNFVIIPTILVVITIILAMLLRSLLAPLMLVATVVLSFAATLGVSQLVFENVFGFPGSDPLFPLFAFVFLVGLGIDYNIFLMTRVREESKKIGTRAGVLKGLTATGGVITSAGIVLAATFAVLGVLPLVLLAQLGFAVAFGVLLDAIVVRALLVPALTYDIGRIIWWPSKLRKGLP
jgi:putative drug exporter of the RND superfamily